MCHRGEGFGKTGSDRSTPKFFALYRSKSIVLVHCKVYLFGGVCVCCFAFLRPLSKSPLTALENVSKRCFSQITGV